MPSTLKKELSLRSQLIKAGRYLFSHNLLPATSGNLSAREAGSSTITITTSGKSKGKLSKSDFIEIDLEGLPINNNADGTSMAGSKSSAETLLHTQIYNFFPEVNFVFHIHSINSVVISKLHSQHRELKLSNYELLKALRGVNTHQHIETLPIFPNTQNIQLLAKEVNSYMETNPDLHAYLIEGHGLYSWGSSASEALRHIEALETLFEIELKLRTLKK